MNTKVTKLRAERSKNEAKIADLQVRNKQIDELITEQENTDIIGLVRATGMTPDQLAALLRNMNHTEKEDTAHEEV